MVINVYGDLYISQTNPKKKNIRSAPSTVNAKTNVKKRDNEYCICCGENKKQIQVHHINPVSIYPRLADEEWNMVCLCQSCHDKYHAEYGIGDVNGYTFREYLEKHSERLFGE